MPPVDADNIDAAIRAVEPGYLDHLDEEFADAVLLVGRVLGARPTATATRITALDRLGATGTVRDAEGEHPLRLDFDAELTDVSQLPEALMALVIRARQASGETGATTAEREVAARAGIRTFLTTVSEVETLHPSLRRITFAGGDLWSFEPLGPDTFLYVLLPPPGREALTIDQGFTWDGYAEMPPGEQPLGAYYTLRHWSPQTAELTMLFVLHGDEGAASRWAARARPGDPVALWGPRTTYEPPADSDWYLLVADETGLPAVATILEALPEGTPARVFAEVASEEERPELPTPPGTEITWLSRGATAGSTTLLIDAVRALPWPGGRPYAWGGGESRAMTAVRRYLREEVGLARDAVTLVAYWRHAAHSDSEA